MKYRIYHNVAASNSKSKRTYQFIDADSFTTEDGLLCWWKNLESGQAVVFAIPRDRLISMAVVADRARRAAS